MGGVGRTEGQPRKSGFILWFTGLSGAGKSTLAEQVREVLSVERQVEVLDG
ncbi:MAG: adenylyl-sulfate kinase, partial [Myxococcales bacterium]